MISSIQAAASAIAQPILWVFGSWTDRYYDRYERNLDKLSKRIASLKAQQLKQKQTHARWTWRSALVALGAVVLASAHKQLAEHWGVETWSPLIYASSTLLIWAIGLLLLQRYSTWRQRSIGRKLQHNQAQLAKLIGSLKDGSHYDKVQQLLRRYDPAYQAPTAVPIKAHGRTTTAAKAPGTPQRVGGLAGAVVGALGSTVEGLANQLAVPGEATTLDALRAAQAECAALRGQVSYWQQLAFACRDVVDRQHRDLNTYRAKLGMDPEQLPGTPLKLAWSEGGEGQPGAPPEAHDSAEQEGIAAVHDVHALEEVPAAGEDKGLRRGRQAAVLLNA